MKEKREGGREKELKNQETNILIISIPYWERTDGE